MGVLILGQNHIGARLMKKKEFVSNNCQLCHHSIKEYLGADNKLTLNGAKYCLCVGMTSKEKKMRMNDKVKCENFKLGRTSKEIQLSNIDETLSDISRQLEWVKDMISELKGTIE